MMIECTRLSQDLKLFLLNNLVYREIHLQSIDFEGVQALQDHSRRINVTAGLSLHNTAAALTVIIFESNSESTKAPLSLPYSLLFRNRRLQRCCRVQDEDSLIKGVVAS